jgi:uncharacterized protein YydD (DUF2326 family)
MFLKSLTISSKDRIIREIFFRKGINLIVDETPNNNELATGNNVGKTTVLKLIDFCLGSKGNGIFADPESPKHHYALVKKFLIKNEILITLILKEDLSEETSNEITIERNFLSRNKGIYRINYNAVLKTDFEVALAQVIFPEHASKKPTFRQIISHNIRYKDLSLTNTLKTLDRYTSDAEYETLYLFLFGCEFENGNKKQNLLLKLKQEDIFRKRLEKEQTKPAYETMLSLIENEIDELNQRKAVLNLNENFEEDLQKLDTLKIEINKISSDLSNFKLRKELIHEAETDLKSDISSIDLGQLRMIYEQATQQISTIQKTFEDLVTYHNQMINEKIKFITKELPSIENEIQKKQKQLQRLLKNEFELTKAISKTDSFSVLEELISDLNEKFRKKGEYESIIEQLNKVEEETNNLNKKLIEIDNELFSDDFEQTVKEQINKFNIYFASISNQLYGEKYALKYDKVVNRKGQQLYKFSAFNTNMSSGKKQGEITCFDVAYTIFADENNVPCLHFLLNDKKELMHDNQLIKIADLVEQENIQFVASILKDKLPSELDDDKYFILKLSSNDKLFRIENSKFNL